MNNSEGFPGYILLYNKKNFLSNKKCDEAKPKTKMGEEQQYIDLIKNVAHNGFRSKGRNDEETISIFGHMSRYSLKDNTLPVITTKRVWLRGVIEELLWFIRGSTNANELKEKNVRIWDGHSSREHLDQCGLNDYKEGDIGPGYGHQWRHCGAPYEGCNADYSGKGIDQLANVIEQLKNNPNSRRMVVCSWNPVDIPKMALPPCHCLFQFYRNDDGISCMMYQRSADISLGVPFNITSYALLTHLVAHEVGVPAIEFVHVIGNAHLYKDHVEPLMKIQVHREPFEFPKVHFRDTLKNIFEATIDDIQVVGYKCHPSIKLEMIV